MEQVLAVCDSLVAAPDVSLAEREGARAIRLYVDGMPTLALERGLFTERELVDRFQRLVSVCRNVVLVPEACNLEQNNLIIRSYCSSFMFIYHILFALLILYF